MDRNNFRELAGLFGEPTAKLHLLSEYLPADAPRDVPDPYHGGPEGFNVVLDLLRTGLPKILDALVSISQAKAG